MLYILPPPSAPSPPSPWTTILCAGGSGNGGVNYKGGPTKTVIQSASWPTINSRKKPPPVYRNHVFKNRTRIRDSGAGGSAAEDEEVARNSRSLSECYFAGKGAAVVLPPNERVRPSRRVSVSGSDIQQHLQSMFYLLRPEETLKMAVKLESVHSGRTRYLVVVSCVGRQDAEESCLLGIDCNEKTTVGLVLRVLADTAITLDGDGGFSVSVCGRQHIFKPVSVQAMWSALQTLHKVSSKAREQNYFLGGLTHDWVSYYEQRIESDRSCLNEWHAMDSIESRRPPSPDSVRTKPLERTETERVIRCTLKEIMMSVDLDEVTSKYIRGRLEEDLDMDLVEFKPFIDQEMLTILGQMDAATEIFDHVYLGSEWNASNLEELQKNGVLHILNVTREIDNFFPGMFNYLNVRVYDDEKTDLLKHWDNTFKYITRAKKEGSKVLVHCKMGVSRSASVVIAYAMKAFNWDFKKAFEHVKEKRSCIKPNTSFISQLETYQGILDAMKNREKLQRSKSETNLKSPGLVAKAEQLSGPVAESQAELGSPERLLGVDWALQATPSGHELSRLGGRPKSWSPDNTVCSALQLGSNPTSVSLEQLNPLPLPPPPLPEARNHNPNVRMPCRNGQAYSVSQNKVVYLPASCKQAQDNEEAPIPSVKHRVNELESQTLGSAVNGRKALLDRKGLVLNLTTQFESPCPEVECRPTVASEIEDPVISQTKLAPQMLTAILVKKEIWDPGEGESPTTCTTVSSTITDCTSPIWTSSSKVLETQVSELSNNSEGNTYISELKLKDSDNINAHTVFPKSSVTASLSVGAERTVARREGDPFSAQLDRVFDREERKTLPSVVPPTLPCVTEVSSEVSSETLSRECPSRQSSWSSYDSAVVLGYQGEPRDAPSRQSSWGSADTRFGTLPSRNSSWGSYDMRPSIRADKPPLIEDFGSSSSGMFPYDRDEIPWYHGTVKRTKQKLEEGTGTVKRVCPDTNRSIEPLSPPLSTSNSPSPHRTAEGTVNYKIHGPRPYQSPSTDKLLSTSGFAFPCPVSNKISEQPFEALNPNHTHYSSSPTLSSCDEKVSLKKMAFSQPNITLNTDSTCAILNKSDFPLVEINFTSSLPDSSRSLSVSAPTPSTLNQINKPETISHPSTSLPAMSSVNPLEVPIPIPCTFLNETPSPCIINTTQYASVKDQKKVLENLTNIVSSVLINRCSSVDNSTDLTKDNSLPTRSPIADSQKSISGLVRNLKKEFEAKSIYTEKTTALGESGENESKKSDVKVKSLPPSPVSTYPETKSPPGVLSPIATAEDLSVKMLVGKYEVSKPLPPGTQPGTRTRLVSENETVHRRIHAQQKSSLPQRKSSLDIASVRNSVQPQPVIKHSLLVHNLKNGCSVANKRTMDVTNAPSGGGDEFRKPPIPPVVRSMGPSPSVVVASVVAKAASKKQQQGKTHPLARLTIKPRHNNPVYNTM